jgi:hypothetical protein
VGNQGLISSDSLSRVMISSDSLSRVIEREPWMAMARGTPGIFSLSFFFFFACFSHGSRGAPTQVLLPRAETSESGIVDHDYYPYYLSVSYHRRPPSPRNYVRTHTKYYGSSFLGTVGFFMICNERTELP